MTDSLTNDERQYLEAHRDGLQRLAVGLVAASTDLRRQFLDAIAGRVSPSNLQESAYAKWRGIWRTGLALAYSAEPSGTKREIKGQSFKSPVSDAQAVSLLEMLVVEQRSCSTFARELAIAALSGTQLSGKQLAWVHRIVLDNAPPEWLKIQLPTL